MANILSFRERRVDDPPMRNPQPGRRSMYIAPGGALTLRAPDGSEEVVGAPAGDFVTSDELDAAIEAVIGAAPGALNTLDELAAALGDDASYAASIATALAGKQPLDADLTAIAALTTTSFGRGLLEVADAAARR